MALTLDGTLATAQDSDSRHPLCEIVSGMFTDPIPFDGQYFNSDVSGETRPAMISLSDGRLAAVFARELGGYDKDRLMYLYTDTNRTQWYSEEIYDVDFRYNIEGKSLVELNDGNVGVVWFEDYISGTGSDHLKCLTLTPTGDVINAASTIASYTEVDYWVDNPQVVDLSGEYQLVYSHCDLAANNYTGEYSIMRRMSSDFSSWAGESVIPIGGTLGIRRKGNPFLFSPSSGNVLLLFDYVDDEKADGSEVVNVYKSESTDLGNTFASGEVVTFESDFGSGMYHPEVDDLSGNSLYLSYHQELSVLHMDVDSTGFCCSNAAFCTSGTCSSIGPTDLHFDPVTRKLYVYYIYNYVGDKVLCNILRIDVDTWTIEKCYSNQSTPQWNDLFSNYHCWYGRNRGEGKYIAVGTCKDSKKHLMVINDDTETIKEYHFDTDVTYGVTQNIDVDWRGSQTYAYLQAVEVDEDNDRVYCYFMNFNRKHWFGYIDLTETADPATGKYTWHEIFYELIISGVDSNVFFYLDVSMLLIPELDYVVFAFGDTISSWKGALLIYGLTSGAQIKDYNVDDHAAFHYRGAKAPVYYDGHIYCHFDYEVSYGQTSRRGLMDIDITADSFIYITPTYATVDDYKLRGKIVTDDGRLIITTGGWGIQIYDVSSGSWTEYSNNTITNLTPDGSDVFVSGHNLAYDESTSAIYAAKAYYLASWKGLLAVNELGSWKRMKYQIGTWTSQWDFSDESDLTLGTLDYDGTIAIDSDNSLWLIWTILDGTEESNKWDKSGATFDVSDYVTGQVEVIWNVEQPNQLSFSCSKGHLFDPSNQMSTMNAYLKKGRKIMLRFGELVNGFEYWHNQGTFVIRDSKLNYKRGTYPIINCFCEDQSYLWTNITIPTTGYFDGTYPESVLISLIEDHANLESGDYNIPADGAMTNSHTLYHQWIDDSLMGIIQELLDHFGYVSNIDVDGDFGIKEIDFTKNVDHTYLDNTKLLEYSPDDSYSTYVNRVIVKGESRSFLEVTYPEEKVGSLSGSTGWWGCDTTKRVYYSDDQSRQVIDPRLDVVEDLTGNSLFTDYFGNVSGVISDEDVNEKWVDITVEVDDLIGVLVAGLVAILATGEEALTCDGLAGQGSHCGPLIFALSIEVQIVGAVLGVIQNYAFDIYGQPIGFEKQTFQAQANDTDFQTELNGLIIPEEIDDPFCYTITECQRVANQEMNVIKYQRSRGMFIKTAHLQDEITDIIQIVHPYSGNNLKFLITTLKRVYNKPDTPEGEGSFLDHIEGWRIT